MHKQIIKAIAEELVWPYDEVQPIYDKMKSYDNTISLLVVSKRCGISPLELESALLKLNEVGARAEEVVKTLKNTEKYDKENR